MIFKKFYYNFYYVFYSWSVKSVFLTFWATGLGYGGGLGVVHISQVSATLLFSNVQAEQIQTSRASSS